MAILLCFLFMLCTQLPAALVGMVLLTFFMLLRPDKFQGDVDAAQLLGSTEGSLAMAGAFLMSQIYVIGFSLFMLRWFLGRDWMRQIALRWPGFQVAVLALASTPAFIFLGNLVYSWLRQALPTAGESTVPGMDVIGELFRSWPATFGVLVIGFGPGIGEELWCRGFLGRGLVGRYGVWTGVLFTSFLFGAIHVDPCQGTMAMLMGLWLHYVYLTTRSLWMPMLLHTVNNSLAVLGTKFAPLEQLDTATTKLSQASWMEQALPIVTAVTLFVVVAWALYRTRARLVAPTGSPDWRPPFLSVECPPKWSQVRVIQGRLSLAGGLLVLLAFLVCLGSLLRIVLAS
jgi:membrane protease YdiL (CAAX protease family)